MTSRKVSGSNLFVLAWRSPGMFQTVFHGLPAGRVSVDRVCISQRHTHVLWVCCKPDLLCMCVIASHPLATHPALNNYFKKIERNRIGRERSKCRRAKTCCYQYRLTDGRIEKKKDDWLDRHTEPFACSSI